MRLKEEEEIGKQWKVEGKDTTKGRRATKNGNRSEQATKRICGKSRERERKEKVREWSENKRKRAQTATQRE